ncbi:MAG: biotin--[acetyl-CoA-carboxylase] ligase [Planctomycetota bacterium]|jgi:BirA family biotin operon repressor/biotin-[acetyl-CoA-carboxylase] ligase
MAEVPGEQLEAFLTAFRPFPQGLAPATIVERTEIPIGELPAIRKRLEKDGFVFGTDAEDEEERWRLVEAPDVLYPYWIRAGLRCDRLAGLIYFQKEVQSTQDIAFELMVEGRPHGTLVLSENQTGGRGRGERAWYSTPGKSLLFSLLLDPEPLDTFASVLTIAIACSVARAIHDVAGLPARIKFPNDILVRGKKVAGILMELKDYGVPTRRAVAGIGINVNQSRRQLPKEIRRDATSLREEHPDKESIPRPRLLRHILQELEHWLDHIARGVYDDLETTWKRYSPMEGKEVRFLKGGEELQGRILEARMREGLLVRLAGGGDERFRLEHLSDLRFL